MYNDIKNKKIDFHINHKVFSVDIGEDKNNRIERGIVKFLDINKNLNIQDVLLAFIQKTNELVELEKQLMEISQDLEDIK